MIHRKNVVYCALAFTAGIMLGHFVGARTPEQTVDAVFTVWSFVLAVLALW